MQIRSTTGLGSAAGLESIAFLLLLNQALGELEPLLEVQHAILELMDDGLQVALEVAVALGIPASEPVGERLSERALDHDERGEEQPEHEDKVTGKRGCWEP